MIWHRLFEAQVDRRPEAPAVVAGERSLTYAELDGRANHLAARLIELGVGVESVIGVHCGRSVELVVSMLAVLKAGAVYLPLDPDYPVDRVRFILDDSGARFLITRQVNAGRVPAGAREVVFVGDEEVDWRDAKRPAERVGPRNLAYVIYTSGSTGQPKGTLLEHRGLCATALAQRAVLQPQDTDRVLQFSSPSFDASIFEIVLALSNGAALHMMAAGELNTGAPLAAFLRRHEITTAVLTPTVLAATEPGSLPYLRLMISAGEPCSAEIVNRWGDGRRFVNAYGPTEATIWASFVDCRPGGDTPSIGGELPGGQLYVLDAGLRPVEAGHVGELCIGGPTVARGYLGRPELTAERFVPDPFSGVPDARLYRTGDLVRRRSGEVEFIGRADHQVKVRGFRVELGEIESQLLAASGVRQAVVTPHGAPGDVRLIAYVVADPAVHNEHLLAGLARTLPAHMVPNYIVRLPDLPLDPNGKIDRAHLREPTPEQDATPPSTPTEEVLAGIWRQVLDLPSVGATDDFFALGGHSVLALRVATAVHARLGVLLSPAALFEHRSIAALGQLIDDRAGTRDTGGPVRQEANQLPAPLSFAQQQVWFLNSISPNNRSYSAHALLGMRGELDPSALARCLEQIVARHEILRTTFVERESGPVQEVHLKGVVPLATVDLRQRRAPERELDLLVEDEIRRPFDPEQLPLVRWTLYRLENRRWALLHSEHHFIHDGWSFAVFFRELTELYRAGREGRPPALPELPIQFADFAVWQRRWAHGTEAAAQLSYWREVLRDSPALLELPVDHPRPAVQSFRGAALRRPLPPQLLDRLGTLARSESTTLFVIFVAALDALLHRCGGGEDIVIGSPFANRRWPQTEHLIGMVINTVTLRVDVSGDPTFRELAGRVEKVVYGAYANQDLPFERVVQELHPQRSLSHNPLFQVLCGFHDTPLPATSLPDLEIEVQEALNNGSAKFDLNVTVIPRLDRPTVIWEYSTDLFERETVQGLAERHERLLAAVAVNPDLRLSELPLLSEEEQHRMLVDWNRTERPAEPLRVHEMVARQSARTPDAIAVRYGDRQVTYAELRRRSDAVTAALLAAGVGPEARVAVCARRSPEMLAALLGVLAAGAAYVPVDPDYPARRVAFMLADAGAEAILTDRELAATLPDHSGLVLTLEEIAEAEASDPRRPGPDLAYVIYTSGSTGTPKGVAVTHVGLANLLRAMAEISGVGLDDVLAAVTSLSFDIAALELFMPLTVGATVVIYDRATTRDPVLLASRNREYGVTIMQATPSTWQALIASGWEGDPGLTALCGGEAMNSALAEAVRARTRVLWNVYGPTETTIWSSAARVGAGPVTIGGPIANTRLHVLDRALRPVPVGVTGELYIGGIGLARGYLGRPDLTADRFVPDPFGDGGRLYRTGDLVCYRRDGNIEFRGRVDDQVKIRGFRIEPGEIEAVLVSHSEISAAAVVVRNERLIAYVATAGGQRPGGVVDWLRERLPEHLLPATVVALERLPLTPNGKLDRRALPDPDLRPARSVPPASERERRIAAIWRSALGVNEVGVEDNFFEAGGHSVLLVGVQRRLREEFGIDVPLLALFQHPTVRAQAAHLGGEDQGDDRLARRRQRGEARRRLLSGER